VKVTLGPFRPRPVRSASMGRRIAVAVTAAALVALGAVVPSSSAWAAGPYSPANGTGSSYSGLAFQQWVDDGQTQGLPVNYTPTSSPAGLEQYESGIIPFTGTEAEFSSLLGTPDASIPGGFEYTPDVAGAMAVMYNVEDQSGRKVTYLHLAPLTIARIFMGYITNWDDPEITADNLGLKLPSKPITVIYRSGQSGTTALFYNFVDHTDPAQFLSWAHAHNLPTTTRIIQLDNGSPFAPLTEAVSGSDQQAEDVASQPWSISYDEFAYPKTYGAQVAWVENAAGKWTQPYALNISAGLESATLNPDLSQNLDGVYTSTNPLTYPISAYSYIVTKCAANARFPTCKGTYSDPGLSNTLGTWMSYIACAGQVHMAEIGYAPLPPGLSQDMANSVARITGKRPVTLSASNCANPRFEGNLGVGAAGPPDPYLALRAEGTTTTTTAPAGSATTAPTTAPVGAGNSGSSGGKSAAGTKKAKGPGTGSSSRPSSGSTAGGGSGSAPSTTATTAPSAVGKVATGPVAASSAAAFRQPQPVAYTKPGPGGLPALPLLAFLLILIVPAVGLGAKRRLSGRRSSP
jgi:phosphate transport system substrate-binding protein